MHESSQLVESQLRHATISQAPLALLACLYLALMAATIDWHGYWSDEFHTINAALMPVGELVRQRASVGHPPLFFLVEKAWAGVFGGASEAAYRSLPALCSLGTLLLTYRIVRREAGDLAAWLACLLLVTCSTQLMVSQLARSYTLLQLLATGHAALLLSDRPPTAWRLLLSTVLSAAAFYTHGAALVAMFTQLAAAALAVPSRWKYVLSGAAGSLLYVPFLFAYPSLDDVERHLSWIPPPTVAALLRFPALLQFGRHLPDTPVFVQAAAVLLIVALAVLALRLSDAAAMLALQWFFTWAAAAAAASFGIAIISVERYFAPAVMCQAAFMAIAIASIAKSRRRLAGFAAACVVLIGLFSSALYFALPPFTPWREMAALVGTKRAPGEIVFVASPRVLATPFAYYFAGESVFADSVPIAPESGARGIWLCFREFNEHSLSHTLTQDARARFPKETAYRFHRGTVVHLTE